MNKRTRDELDPYDDTGETNKHNTTHAYAQTVYRPHKKKKPPDIDTNDTSSN